MELGYMNTLPQESGFNYDNCLRNMALTNNKGMGMQTNITTMKTGTTICGLIYKVSWLFSWFQLTNNSGWCSSCSRHPCHWWQPCGRQELREDPFLSEEHLLLWCRYRCRLRPRYR
jgi:hypothetical protein